MNCIPILILIYYLKLPSYPFTGVYGDDQNNALLDWDYLPFENCKNHDLCLEMNFECRQNADIDINLFLDKVGAAECVFQVKSIFILFFLH